MGKKAAIVACAPAGAARCSRRRRTGAAEEGWSESDGKWERAAEMVKELKEKCGTPVWKLRQVADAMVVEMHAGLASDGGSKLKMLISYVDSLPTGDEKGLYYALDLGGTNFRVLRVHLGGKEKGIIKREFEEVSILPHLMTRSSNQNLLLQKVKIRIFTLVDRGSSVIPSRFQLGNHRSHPGL